MLLRKKKQLIHLTSSVSKSSVSFRGKGVLAVNLSSKNRRREAASPYWVGIMEQDDPWTDWDKMSQLR
jgi:hypothetical protein